MTKDLDTYLVIKPDIELTKDYDEQFLLEKEKEVFGFYLSKHPTTIFQKDNPYCLPINEIDNNFGKTIDNLILIEKIKVIDTKKNEKMAFITGSDHTGSMEFILFPKLYKLYSNLEKGNIIKTRGTVEKRMDETQVIINKIKVLQGESNEQ